MQKKAYLLIEFPYPSGDGLHVGHVRSYTALDVVARKKRMEGMDVLFPIGWDAFGLPTENYALKTGRHPAEITKENIATFERQLKALGLSFDWSRMVNTTDPSYYKWTQWIFLQFLKRGLAYQAEMPINWCPQDKIGLANEEVVGGKCERCGTAVVKKKQKQWMLKITAYAERLLNDLETVDYLPHIKEQQKNWIGRSEGAEIQFKIQNSKLTIPVFTTRPDTLFGATYLVVAPEYPALANGEWQMVNSEEVQKYLETVQKKSELERTDLSKEKTGVELKGVKAINPATKEEIPIWAADFVLGHYGTGAVFADAHDQRDFDFARRYGIPLKTTLKPFDGSDDSEIRSQKRCYEGKGILYDSGEFSGLTSDEAIPKITEKFGKQRIQYKLRDWVFSRQHYWGEPIPVVHCKKCGVVPVPEKDLPVELPYVEKYQPTNTGESPLANITEWVNTKCPQCGGPAKRETDTMPNWAGSSWYYLRYCDPHNNKKFVDKKKLKYWLPVDIYNGGMEHTVLHLLYSRFWHKFLYDEGLVPTSEPYAHRHSHGIVLGEDGRKMSKSYGNVVNPDDLIKEYGVDSLRLYEMFMGPFEDMIPWSHRGIVGCHRFLNAVAVLLEKKEDKAKRSAEAERWRNQTIKKVDEDIDGFRFNTAVSALMEYVNVLKHGEASVDDRRTLLLLLYPFAPHLASELWERHFGGNISKQTWPSYNEKKLRAETFELVVQVNGKVRSRISAQQDIGKEEALKLAMEDAKVKQYVVGEPKKVVFVKGKLLSIVTG